ncbi:MAG: 4Fe-4S binding protein [Gammaproteobacteria bacterium]
MLALTCAMSPGIRAQSPTISTEVIGQLFPADVSMTPLPGPPEHWRIHKGNTGPALGHAVQTINVAPIPAYSGKAINALVGVDSEGIIKGVRILQHSEPILAVGLSDAEIDRFTAQYAGLKAGEDIRIGGREEPGRPVIDGLSGATITAMVINRSVVKTATAMARLHPAAEQTPSPLAMSANIETPLWKEHWSARMPEIVILSMGLLVLILILLFQDWLARHPRWLLQLRLGYLLFTLVFIGLYTSAQLSVVNLLTFVQSLLHGFRWDSYLIDPALFLLWSFTAITVLLWGRGVYCGWLCPFGALQELLFRLARRLGIPEWEPPAMVHERLLALKYLVWLGLFALSLQWFREAARLAEIEPFKTVFALRMDRAWPFVAYVLILLFLGLLLRKAYCRYLCPLGAALTFPSRFRVFDWLRRRKECGRPCQTCFRECEVRAIKPTGEIVDSECHYCLDCQVTYWNSAKCPPLADKKRRALKHAKSRAKRETDSKERPGEPPETA